MMNESFPMPRTDPTRALRQGRSLASRRWAAACVAGVAFGMAGIAQAFPSVYPTGVTRYDPAKAWNGYVLFSAQDKQTHLIDMNGQDVKVWPHEGFPSVLLDPAINQGRRGHVLVQLANQAAGQSGAGAVRHQTVGEVDWNGKVVWAWQGVGAQDAYGGAGVSTEAAANRGGARQHNDWRRLPNGNTVILVNVLRQLPGFKADKVLDDAIYEVTPTGQITWQWAAGDHLLEFGFSDDSLKLLRETLTRGDRTVPFDYLHLNNLSVVGPNKWHDAGDQRFHPDNLLIGSRHANLLAIIDRKTGAIAWRLGPDYPSPNGSAVPRPVDQIIGQHDAHIIPPGLPGAGNLLVFDNQGEAGYPRVGPGAQPRSRVLEIDPVSKHIVWQYTGTSSGRVAWSFYSSFISSARRLPNGNTLIDEGMNGRIFQVTPGGEIVWEYVSPHFGESRNGGDGQAVLSNSLYRAQPVPYDWAPSGTPRSENAVRAPDVRTFRVAPLP